MPAMAHGASFGRGVLKLKPRLPRDRALSSSRREDRKVGAGQSGEQGGKSCWVAKLPIPRCWQSQEA